MGWASIPVHGSLSRCMWLCCLHAAGAACEAIFFRQGSRTCTRIATSSLRSRSRSVCRGEARRTPDWMSAVCWAGLTSSRGLRLASLPHQSSQAQSNPGLWHNFNVFASACKLLRLAKQAKGAVATGLPEAGTAQLQTIIQPNRQCCSHWLTQGQHFTAPSKVKHTDKHDGSQRLTQARHSAAAGRVRQSRQARGTW